jgi:hypothetical protein
VTAELKARVALTVAVRSCGFCAHWLAFKEATTQDKRGCDRLYVEHDLRGPSNGDERFGVCVKFSKVDSRYAKVPDDALAFAEDGSGYLHLFRTRAEFGCVSWEPKP